MSEIALVGAYSIDNYGDKLYPQILEGLLRTIGVEVPPSLYGLTAGTDGRGHPVLPARDLWRRDVRAVLVGGGDILRTDTHTVLADHANVYSSARRRPENLLRFRLRALASRGAGPGAWLPRRGWHPKAPGVLVSAGVHKLPRTAAVLEALSHLKGAWVRHGAARGHLEAGGMAQERIVVAPDAVFALPHLIDREWLQARGRRLLREATGSTSPVLLIHAAPFTGWSAQELARLSSRVRAPSIFVALGRYCGEERLLRRAAEAAGRPFVEPGSTEDTTAMLSAAGCIVSTSMHAAIVGATFGRPIVTSEIGKTVSALAACPDPPQFVNAARDEIAAKVHEVIGTQVEMSSERNTEAVLKAFRHMSELVGLA